LGLVLAAIFVAERFIFFRLLYRAAAKASPILLLVVLGMTMLIYNFLHPKGPQPVVIKFDPTQARLFSSWDDPYFRKISKGQIWVFGAEKDAQKTRDWIITDEYTAGFSFKADGDLDPKYPEAVSGGWVRFYETPIDTRNYRQVRFSSKVEDAGPGSSPDFGIRLCVDSSDGHEAAVYEVSSVRQNRNISLGADWQSYALDLTEFLKKARYNAVSDTHINQYTVNKIAIFVNLHSIAGFRSGTVWLRDIRFEPLPHR
jgi:hypothetical protein